MIINNNSGVRCLPKRFIWPRAAVASVYFLPVFLVVSVSFFQKGWKIFTVVECYTLGATPGSVFQSSWSFFCLRNEGNSVITRGIRFFSLENPTFWPWKPKFWQKLTFFFVSFDPRNPKYLIEMDFLLTNWLINWLILTLIIKIVTKKWTFL